MVDKILNFLKYIVPPKDAQGVTGWRWGIFVVVLVLAVNAASGRGVLMGYGAHAAATDVKMILELQLAEEIRNIHTQLCTLPMNARQSLQNVLEDYQRRYRELTGSRYPLPICPP